MTRPLRDEGGSTNLCTCKLGAWTNGRRHAGYCNAANIRKERDLPCPHGRQTWRMCPHCLGIGVRR